MNARTVDRCGLCGSENLDLVFSLGSSPPTCVMQLVNGGRAASEEHHPLELLRCGDCTLVQLSAIVDPEIVFPPSYPYSSGNSKALHKNFEDLVDQARACVFDVSPNELVVDIGANDGTLLSKWGNCRKVGVEPTIQAVRIDAPAYVEFFSSELARRIVAEHGQATVITACNVLAHVADIHDVMQGISILLADDGVLVAENHDLKSVVGGQWDTVYHEHLRFYDPYTFSCLLAEHDMKTVTWGEIPTHGGSFRTVAKKGGCEEREFPGMRDYDFDRLKRQAAGARAAIRNDLAGTVWGIGATARATTIINYCGIDVEDVQCVCEVPTSDKIGHYIPGTRIPVVDEARLFEEQPPRVILFSWHLADTIVPKLQAAGYKGTFIVPLPRMEHRYPATMWQHKTPTGKFG